MKRRVLPIFLVLLAPTAAFADPPGVAKADADEAAARVLFYDARQLMGKGLYIDACPKLEESMRLDAGVGTKFNLADCNEHIGKLASAWAGFIEVAAESKAMRQPEREKVARKRAAALEPRLPRLAVDVPAPAPGLEVRRDGVLIGPAAFGTAIPVDAGTLRIVATAPGKQRWETVVQAAESKTARIVVPRELPPRFVAVARAAPSAAQVDDGIITTSAETMLSIPPPVVEHPGSTQRAFGWIVAGIGVAGLGVGAGFGLSSIRKRDDSRKRCVVDQCDADGVSLRDDAIKNGNVATIATIAGGAAVVGGLILVLTAPKRTREQSGKLRALPTAAQNGGGFMVQGNFQ